MLIRGVFFACLVSPIKIHSDGYQLRRFDSRSQERITYHQSSSFLFATVEDSKVDSISSEFNDKDENKIKNSGLFRKISYSNKDFEFDEILSPGDVKQYQNRFHKLMILFPNVSEKSLRAMVFVSPLLLALETEDLQVFSLSFSHSLPLFLSLSF
jgi:hypothetical protein